MSQSKWSKGSSAAMALIILLVVTVVGWGGWYVWKNNKTEPTRKTSQTTKKTEEKTEEDPTKEWKPYSNEELKFSLRYPPSWLQLTCSNSLMPSWGANSDTVGKCGPRELSIVSTALARSQEGDTRADTEYDPNSFKDLNKNKVTVDGVEGVREDGVEDDENCNGICHPAGTKLVQYIFFTNNRTYVIEYRQRPVDPDVLSDFDLMVTRTFKFSD